MRTPPSKFHDLSSDSNIRSHSMQCTPAVLDMNNTQETWPNVYTVIIGIVFISVLLACLATENYRGQGLMDGHRDRETGTERQGQGSGKQRTYTCYTKSPSVIYLPLYLPASLAVVQSHSVHRTHFCNANILQISSAVVVTGQRDYYLMQKYER